MALAQGSGELIFWPQMMAKYGLAFLFLLVPACLLQFPVTFEIGRYTLLTGEGVFRGFFRLHRGFGLLLWLMFTVSFFWFGAFATAGCTAFAELTGFPRGWEARSQMLFWAQSLIVVFTVALLWVKAVYRLIEWVMKVVAIVSLAGMAIACTHADVRSQLGAFLKGMVIPDVAMMRTFDPADAERLLTAITFAGLGGFWTLFYSYWMREKGIGMAAQVGRSLNSSPSWAGVEGGASDAAPLLAALPAETPDAVGQLRRWYRYLGLESLVGIVGNIATTLMTCLLAYALLHPKGRVPEGERIAVEQAEFFAVSWGQWGRLLFLFIAGSFLADTWLATVDCVSRIHMDALGCLWPRAAAIHPRKLYNGLVLTGAVVTSATMYLKQPEPLILTSAVIGFAGTVIYCIALIAINHGKLRRALPISLQPSRRSLALIGFSTFCYLVLAGIYLWMKIG